MLESRRILVSLAALAAAALLVPAGLAPAAQRKRTRHDVARASVKLKSQRGGVSIYTGTSRSRLFGRGSIRQENRLQGLRAVGRFTVHYPRGIIRGTNDVTVKFRDGKINIRGKVRYTSGTGRYRGIRGSGTVTGTGTLNSAKFKQKGTVRY